MPIERLCTIFCACRTGEPFQECMCDVDVLVVVVSYPPENGSQACILHILQLLNWTTPANPWINFSAFQPIEVFIIQLQTLDLGTARQISISSDNKSENILRMIIQYMKVLILHTD